MQHTNIKQDYNNRTEKYTTSHPAYNRPRSLINIEVKIFFQWVKVEIFLKQIQIVSCYELRSLC
jgi:hypothetical protein